MDQPTQGRIPIWLDCDTGHDDAYAILLAAYHPRSQLLGVSTVAGNAPLDRTTHNTLAVLEAIATAVPVVQGSSRPLAPTRPPCFATSFHGESGLDGVTLLPKTTSAPLAVHADTNWTNELAAIILAQPADSVWLVPTGPLTNIANLLLLHPQVATHLAGLSIMGGAIGGGYTSAPLGRTSNDTRARFGNWSRVAEFNIFADPEAANVVFGNPRLASKTVMSTLDLTHQVRATPSVRELLFGKQHLRPAMSGAQTQELALTNVRELMREILLFFTAAYATGFNITDGPPLHDPVAVFAALRPELFDDRDGERWIVKVVVDGEEAGRTLIESAAEGVRVPRGVDLQTFWSDVAGALTKAETARHPELFNK